MPGCLGAHTLGYYHCNKEPGQPVGRHALRGDCLGPPVFFLLPEPGAASLRSYAPDLGLSMRTVAALQSPGSRRGVAPHRLCAPQPPLYSPALPRGCNRPPGPRSAAAPSGDLHPLPSAPLGLPLRRRVAPDDRFAATGATLRLKSPLFCPVPADFASLRLPVLGLLRGRLRVLRTLRSSAKT